MIDLFLQSYLNKAHSFGHHRRTRSGTGDGISSVSTPNLQPEFTKLLVSYVYMFMVFWVTAFVMAVVHDRVPDMKKYPPLPDIVLDNLPYIPWAFDMCEFIAVCLTLVWCCILLFHKHRLIIMEYIKSSNLYGKKMNFC